MVFIIKMYEAIIERQLKTRLLHSNIFLQRWSLAAHACLVSHGVKSSGTLASRSKDNALQSTLHSTLECMHKDIRYWRWKCHRWCSTELQLGLVVSHGGSFWPVKLGMSLLRSIEAAYLRAAHDLIIGYCLTSRWNIQRASDAKGRLASAEFSRIKGRKTVGVDNGINDDLAHLLQWLLVSDMLD